MNQNIVPLVGQAISSPSLRTELLKALPIDESTAIRMETRVLQLKTPIEFLSLHACGCFHPYMRLAP